MSNHQTLPKIKLRAMEPEDLDVLYKIENDTSLWGVGVTNVPYSRYTLHDYIANSVGDIYTDKQVRLMIDNEQGQTVGIIDITDFDPRHRRAELGDSDIDVDFLSSACGFDHLVGRCSCGYRLRSLFRL